MRKSRSWSRCCSSCAVALCCIVFVTSFRVKVFFQVQVEVDSVGTSLDSDLDVFWCPEHVVLVFYFLFLFLPYSTLTFFGVQNTSSWSSLRVSSLSFSPSSSLIITTVTVILRCSGAQNTVFDLIWAFSYRSYVFYLAPTAIHQQGLRCSGAQNTVFTLSGLSTSTTDCPAISL
jgi:hypothetical protein